MAGGHYVNLGNTAKISSSESADVDVTKYGVQEEKLDENHEKQKKSVSM